jgi:hypothetical protein
MSRQAKSPSSEQHILYQNSIEYWRQIHDGGYYSFDARYATKKGKKPMNGVFILPKKGA